LCQDITFALRPLRRTRETPFVDPRLLDGIVTDNADVAVAVRATPLD
jgi:hypothetical protein